LHENCTMIGGSFCKSLKRNATPIKEAEIGEEMVQKWFHAKFDFFSWVSWFEECGGAGLSGSPRALGGFAKACCIDFHCNYRRPHSRGGARPVSDTGPICIGRSKCGIFHRAAILLKLFL
jgi:hypothetical protein